jgi:hypothetical protein
MASADALSFPWAWASLPVARTYKAAPSGAALCFLGGVFPRAPTVLVTMLRGAPTGSCASPTSKRCDARRDKPPGTSVDRLRGLFVDGPMVDKGRPTGGRPSGRRRPA